MLELIVMVGPAGSGKSTWVKDFVNGCFNKFQVVSTDDIREEFFGDASVQTDGWRVFKEAYRRIGEYLENGESVIFDATNLRRSDRKRLIKKYRYLNPILSCHAFLTTFDECVARQEERDRKVPPEVIARQFNAYDLPDYSEGWHCLKFHHFIDL